MSEGSSRNPYNLTSESDEEEDGSGIIADQEKSICVGILRDSEYLVWARVISLGNVGYRVESLDIDGIVLSPF